MPRKVPLKTTERGALWQAIIVASAIGLTYSNSLSGPFILDDQGAIVQNSEIRELSRLDRILRPGLNSSESGRPIVNLSFAINYAAGGLDVFGYHVWNIAVHIVCALLVFGIVRRTLELPGFESRLQAGAGAVAFAVALLWAVHPLNSEVVDYLTQRTESMMAAFLLLTLYAAIREFTSPRAWWRALAILSCVLGMACKESMVTAPVLVALYDRIYLYESWKEAFRSRGRLYLGLAATWLVLAGLVVSGGRTAVGGFSSGVSVWIYLLNQTVILTEYLRLTIWPSSLVVFYGWPLPLSLAAVAWNAALILGLLTATVIALVRAPKWGFLGAWFFITLAPTSSIIAIATEVGAERRMYLPLIALAVLAVVGGYVFVSRFSARLRAPSALRRAPPRPNSFVIPAIVLLAIAGGLAATTVVRNREYASGLSLARTVVDRRPTGIAHHILGEQLLLAGRETEAVAHLREAVAGGDSRARYQLGATLLNEGNTDEALEHFEAFVQTSGKPVVPRWLDPPMTEVLTARAVMADVLLGQQRWPEAVAQARVVLEKAPSHVGARRTLAAAMFGQERWPEAVREYRDYLRVNPRDSQGLVNLGIALVATGDMDAAVETFRRAVDVAPTNPNAKRLLEMAIRDRASSAPSRQ